MASLGQITLKGKSGKEYKFEIYNFKSSWSEVAVIYVVTYAEEKQDGGHTHSILYVGQTDNLKERFENHHKQDCFDRNKANRLCLLLESNEKTRVSIEADLIDRISPPCNN